MLVKELIAILERENPDRVCAVDSFLPANPARTVCGAHTVLTVRSGSGDDPRVIISNRPSHA